MSKRIITVFIIALVVAFARGQAYSQSLSELKAQAREEVRREMGLDRLPAARPSQSGTAAAGTASMPARSPQEIAWMLAFILAGISLLPAGIARVKGRSFIAWWVLSMLFFPGALLGALLMKDKTAREKDAVKSGTDAVTAGSPKRDNSFSNRAFIRGFFDEIFANRNLGAADELLAEGFVGHGMPEGTPYGREGFKQYFGGIFRSFPDIECKVEDVVADEDKAVIRWTARGTHGGEFNGIAPTGRPVRIKGVSIYRIKDGKVAELWGETDIAGVMKQLG